MSVDEAGHTDGTVDYYAVLEVPPTATLDVIRAAYKRQALRWHPDKNAANREAAEQRFKQIAQAYEVLGNEESRRAYDADRAAADERRASGMTFQRGRNPSDGETEANGRRRSASCYDRGNSSDHFGFHAWAPHRHYVFVDPFELFRTFFAGEFAADGGMDGGRDDEGLGDGTGFEAVTQLFRQPFGLFGDAIAPLGDSPLVFPPPLDATATRNRATSLQGGGGDGTGNAGRPVADCPVVGRSVSQSIVIRGDGRRTVRRTTSLTYADGHRETREEVEGDNEGDDHPAVANGDSGRRQIEAPLPPAASARRVVHGAPPRPDPSARAPSSAACVVPSRTIGEVAPRAIAATHPVPCPQPPHPPQFQQPYQAFRSGPQDGSGANASRPAVPVPEQRHQQQQRPSPSPPPRPQPPGGNAAHERFQAHEQPQSKPQRAPICACCAAM